MQRGDEVLTTAAGNSRQDHRRALQGDAAGRVRLCPYPDPAPERFQKIEYRLPCDRKLAPGRARQILVNNSRCSSTNPLRNTFSQTFREFSAACDSRATL